MREGPVEGMTGKKGLSVDDQAVMHWHILGHQANVKIENGQTLRLLVYIYHNVCTQQQQHK